MMRPGSRFGKPMAMVRMPRSTSKESILYCLPAVRPFGRVACVLPPQGDLSPLYQKKITLHGTFLTRERQRLEEMWPLFERKQVRAVIDTVLPLQEVGKA